MDSPTNTTRNTLPAQLPEYAPRNVLGFESWLWHMRGFDWKLRRWDPEGLASFVARLGIMAYLGEQEHRRRGSGRTTRMLEAVFGSILAGHGWVLVVARHHHHQITLNQQFREMLARIDAPVRANEALHRLLVGNTWVVFMTAEQAEGYKVRGSRFDSVFWDHYALWAPVRGNEGAVHRALTRVSPEDLELARMVAHIGCLAGNPAAPAALDAHWAGTT